MTGPAPAELSAIWARHHAEWRATAQVTSQWREAAQTEPRLLSHRVTGEWWELLAATGLTLLVTREYEHLVMALSCAGSEPNVTFFPMPHPSGMAVDPQRGVLHVASTRNPNQVYDLVPTCQLLARLDVPAETVAGNPLVPLRSRFLPGCLYLHDLAFIGGVLHANAVGQNAVIRLDSDGGYKPVWWPRSIEADGGPLFGRNHLQLNSIAAGADLSTSFFSASTDRVSRRRPGHKNFPVKQRGVIFSGATREPMAWKLTRPHSARLQAGRLWVDNSGYGEVGFIEAGEFVPIVKLPGWTRGLCLRGRIAFVGTSRVIPAYRQYAPGLDVDASVCGVHAVDLETGQVLGSVTWPYGNQVFAIETIAAQTSQGFPFSTGKRASARERRLFYAFQPHVVQGNHDED